MESRRFGDEQLGKVPEIWGITKLHSRRTRYRPLGFAAGFWRSLPENHTLLNTHESLSATSGGFAFSRRLVIGERAARTHMSTKRLDSDPPGTAVGSSAIPETPPDLG